MRLKGMQCLDEAERLDRLYEAVMGEGDAAVVLPVGAVSYVEQGELSR